MARNRFRPSRRVPRSILLPGLGVLLLLAACGGDERSSAEGPAPGAAPAAEGSGREYDPCALVTAAEAAEVLGAPAETERPSEANNEYMATCRYVAPRGQSVAVLVVTVSRKNGTAGFENARRMEEEGFALQPVPGVGDDALWVGDPLHTLYVLQDTVYLQVGGDVALEQAQPLAERAVERLR